MKTIILSVLAAVITVLIILGVLYQQSIKCESVGTTKDNKVLMYCTNGSSFYLEKP